MIVAREELQNNHPIIEVFTDEKLPEVTLDNRIQCVHCNRFFNPQSHIKHSNICNKVFMMRRNNFPTHMFRIDQELLATVPKTVADME